MIYKTISIPIVINQFLTNHADTILNYSIKLKFILNLVIVLYI